MRGFGFASTSPVSRRRLSQRLVVEHRDAEDLRNLRSWHPAIYSFEHLES